ncbi:Hsp20/alpha crystallin family protein [Acholeplasma equirhinis]|uniref:Hsp20/alpha crystallin family protein n=1 Tax=Acholeplasma equirhinis TaxID=555393 RepID=UPI00197B0171|nr:Hsp20/alpha crystallin family protein [Acholeplasma equirhinis]MBN3490052.1 Hsp20/alpha crystallin family protein [Acholeplasma equirhinis]
MLSLFRRDKDIFDSFFDDFNNAWPFQSTTKLMKTDIIEKENGYHLDIELPGFKKEDIKVSLNDGYIEIEAETKNEHNEKKDGKFIRQERYYGSMRRNYYVGDINLDDIKGSFENGILHLEIPKENKQLTERKYLELK